MQRHHLHAVFPFLGLAFARLEHRVRQEGHERRHVTVFGLEAAGGADQFLEVLEPRLTLVGLLFLVMADQAAGLDHVIDLFV